ncbi:MAG: hypothetical protein IJC32_00760, partial [Clostridia bacterium]|nr:hypothetical protein [Clostridia bacterium]
DLAHLVERDLAKVEVAGSSPVIRSKKQKREAKLLSFVFRSRNWLEPLQSASQIGSVCAVKISSLTERWRKRGF